MSDTTLGLQPSPALPVRHIELADLKASLAAAFGDFLAKPSHMFFLFLIYPIVGVLIAQQTAGRDLLPLLFPLVAGFAILGPFAALVTYEASRRREIGLPTSWRDLAALGRHPAIRQVAEMALILMLIFVAWLGVAHLIYTATMGPGIPATFGTFVANVLTTPGGWALIVVGNCVGFIFAALAFTIGVVSFPLLLDRKVGVGTAIATSVRAVAANPSVLTCWGFIVAAGLAFGFLTLFVGLAVVLPILGHATWHLYRRLVA